MGVTPDDHLDLRRPVQAARLDVPTGLGQHGMSGGGETHCVAQAGARREANPRVMGEAEQVEHPGSGYQLGSGGGG